MRCSCDGPDDDCATGRPATCSESCAPILLNVFDECSTALGTEVAAQFSDVVALCRETQDGPPLKFTVSAAACLLTICLAGLRFQTDAPLCNRTLR